MLPNTTLVRRTIERYYDKTCTVTEYQKTKVNGVVSFAEVQVLIDVPCRLSYKTITSNNETDSVSHIHQVTKLFISPDVTIPTGSKITVDNTDYSRSGVPAVYDTHQEIILELFKGWS